QRRRVRVGGLGRAGEAADDLGPEAAGEVGLQAGEQPVLVAEAAVRAAHRHARAGGDGGDRERLRAALLEQARARLEDQLPGHPAARLRRGRQAEGRPAHALRSRSTGITSSANSRASSREKVSTSRRRAPVSSMTCWRPSMTWSGVPETAMTGRPFAPVMPSTWNSASVSGMTRPPPARYSFRNVPNARAMLSRLRSACSGVAPIATKRSIIRFAPERACP